MADYLSVLSRYVASHPAPAKSPEQTEEETLWELDKLLSSQNQERLKRSEDSSADVDSSSIPRFYYPKPPPNSFLDKLSREARTRYLERRAEEILDDRELLAVWEKILQRSVEEQNEGKEESEEDEKRAENKEKEKSLSSLPPLNTRESSSSSSVSATSSSPSLHFADRRIGFANFLSIRHELKNPKLQRFFTPRVFGRFPRSPHGTISIRHFYRYILRKVQYTRIRISLTCYDEIGSGYLQEHDVENYVYDQLPALPALSMLDRDFYPYYVFTAVRKFFFFLDPNKRGRLKIKELCISSHMMEFDELRSPKGGNPHLNLIGPPPVNEYTHLFHPPASGSVDPGRVGANKRKRNWFSAQSTQDVYAIYLALDSNQNGMLSKQEFARFAGGSLTSQFIEHLFTTVRMYPNKSGELEMDYKTFLDFVLAMEYKQSVASIQYFFKILDIQGQGYLDLFTIHYWFRAICAKMANLGHEPPNVSDVANEVFDMANPSIPGKISLKDLLCCKCGHTILSILIDVNGFWKYDNRETLMHQENNEEA